MIKIRLATTDDAESIRSIYAPYIESTAITFHTEVPPVDYFRKQIEQLLRDYPWYVAELESDEVVGYAYASQHHPRPAYRWSANASIYLDAKHHARGIGRMLYEQLFATLRQQGFRMIHAGITQPNDASIRIHEAFGFKHVGTFPAAGFKLGAWKDVGWWVFDLMEGLGRDVVVAEPTPFSKLTQ